MEQAELRWEANISRQAIRLFRGESEVASIQFNSLFSSKATAKFGEKSFTFLSDGKTKTGIEVYSDNQKVEALKMNIWSSAATTDDQQWKWKNNTFRTKWHWKNPDMRKVIDAQTTDSFGLQGKVVKNSPVSGTDEERLLLTGLYLHYFTYRNELLIVIVLVLVIVIT